MKLLKLLPLITFPLMIKLVAGFYVSDVFIFLIIFFKIKQLLSTRLDRLQIYLLFLFVILLIYGFFGLIIWQCKLESASSDKFLDYFEYPIKLLLFFIYIFYFRHILLKTRININIYVLFLFIPLIISLLSFFSPFLSSIIMKVYRLDIMFRSWRFGGIFGGDVNSFGMYSSLIFIFLIAFAQRLKNILLFIGMPMSLGCILLSGMRTGLLVMFLGFAFIFLLRYCWGNRDSIISLKLIKISILLFVIFILVGSILFTNINIEAIGDRFSIEALTKDFDSNEQGNLAQAQEYFNEVTNNRFTMSNFILGKSPALTYVDSFYINVIIKYGILFLLFALMLLFHNGLFFSIYNRAKTDNLSLFLIIFTFLVAIKGVFPMANYYVFIVFSMFWFSKQTNKI